MPTAKRSSPQHYLAAVDDYIHNAAPFAQPMLERVREAVHKAVPEVIEEIKWSMPFFTYRGIILANMAGFKQHCSFGIWKENVLPLMKQSTERRGTGMGSFGKMKSLEDMPATAELEKALRAAAAKIDSGERTKNWERPAAKAPRPPAEIPPALAAALKSNRSAAAHFEAFSAGCRREYIDWINEAKREQTRAQRIATTVEWVAEGKRHNWKYEKKRA